MTGVDVHERAPAPENHDALRAAPEKQPRRRRPALFATICALVALLASGVGLFWDFLPQYRPDPLDTVGADIAVVAVEYSVATLVAPLSVYRSAVPWYWIVWLTMPAPGPLVVFTSR